MLNWIVTDSYGSDIVSLKGRCSQEPEEFVSRKWLSATRSFLFWGHCSWHGAADVYAFLIPSRISAQITQWNTWNESWGLRNDWIIRSKFTFTLQKKKKAELLTIWNIFFKKAAEGVREVVLSRILILRNKSSLYENIFLARQNVDSWTRVFFHFLEFCYCNR